MTIEIINAGDRVRSYDFPGVRDDCYVVGVCEKLTDSQGYPSYMIKVEYRVIKGERQLRHPDYVFPPVNGTTGLFGPSAGVTKETE